MIRARVGRVRSIRSAVDAISKKPMKVAAFLFDLDGTLIDSESLWARAIINWIVSCGGQVTLEEIMPIVIGHCWIDIANILHAKYPCLGATTPQEDAIIVRGFFAAIAGDPRDQRIPSSVDFFHRAAKLAPCAIVSGSPHDDIIHAAEACGIQDELALVLGAGEYAAGKPSPSGYLRAAELLGVKPEECVVIEDSSVGVASGVAAGMKVIALDHGAALPQDFTGATWCVKSLADLDFEKEFS